MEPFRQGKFAELPAQPRVPHGFFAIPERRVSVRTEAFGETSASLRVAGTGPPLLLVHGLMTTAYSWRYVFAPLAERFTVYAVDLPGAGRTTVEHTNGPYTPENLGEWLHGLVHALGIAGCAVVGNSMGGYLTMVWALTHPQDLSRLVVLHSPAAPIPRLWALWGGMRLPGARGLLGALVGGEDRALRWAHRNVHYWDESLKSLEEAREYGAPLATPAGLDGFFGHLRDTMDVRALGRFRDTLLGRRARKEPFPVPLLLVYARRDPMVPPEIGARLAEWLPEARLAWLDEASHFAHVDASARFLEVIDPFLA